MFLIRWILKIANFIPGWIIFGPRRYFLGSLHTTLFFRGPAVISMNHTAFLDYIVAILMFAFRRMDVLVSEAMYNYNPVIRFLLKCLGVIKVPAFTGNMSAVNEAMGKLKKGHLILIFPEGKIETTQDLLEYRQSVALLAISAGVPVIPIFHDGNIKLTKMDKVFIGSPMYAEDYTAPEDKLADAAKKFTAAIYEKTKLFHDNYYRFFYSKNEKKKKSKNKLALPNHFVKYTSWPVIKILIRPRVICENEIARMALYNQKRMLIICNHTWWIDNPLIHILFFRRRIRSTAAKDVADKSSAQKMMQIIMGSIFIDRYGFDWPGIKTCIDELKNEGCIAVCPEGSFNFSEKLLPFHKGAAVMAEMAKAPVIPVYINSAYEFLCKSYLFVGEPVWPKAGNSKTSADEFNALLEEKMDELRKKAFDNTPAKEQERIFAARAKNKAKVANFG